MSRRPLSSAFPVMCHCEPVTDVTGVAIRIPALRLRRLPFFLRRKKGRKERRQNQWFWNPFRGQDTARSGTIQPRELSTAKFAPCLRILSASNAAMRSAPVLAWRDGGNLCVCRAGRCGHRPLRLFIGNRCVGVGLPDDPNRACAAALAKLSLRASDRCHWCGNPSPYTVPLVPRSDLLPHYLNLKSPVQRQIRLGCGPHQIP